MMNINPHLFTFLTFLFIFSGNSASAPLDCPPTNKKLGLFLNEVQEKSPGNQREGCQIKNIIPFSQLWYSRLRAGDWIASINELNLRHSNSPCKQLRQAIHNALNENKAIHLGIHSKSSDFSIILPAGLYNLNNFQLLTALSERQLKSNENTDNHLAQWQKHLQNTFLIPDNRNSLNKELSCLSDAAPAPVLPIVKHIQAHPMTVAAELEKLQQQIITYHSDSSLSLLINTVQSITFPTPKNVSQNQIFSGPTNNLLDTLEIFIQTSHKLSEEAFTQVSPEERRFFLSHYAQLSSTINQSYSLLNEPDRQNLQTIRRLFEIAAKVDYSKLTVAAQHWFQLTELTAEYWRKHYQPEQALSPFSHRPSSRNTPYGTIILGSYGDDSYYLDSSKQTIALIIDPGGDDHYSMTNANTPLTNIIPFNTAIIDWSGNDFYEATQKRGFALATLGISLLMDNQGDDRYQGHSWSQGSAFAGIAALYDLNGNDTYNAGHFSQAAAIFGSGILVDNQGNDQYKINHHGQGLGLPYGHGVLLDRQGNDNYQSQNGLTSSYSQPSLTTESWSQGCGKGFRYILPGGIGLLMDAHGADRFTAHEFAQGGGYYYGMGLLYNLGKGNDHYLGSRYNVGYAAHQAIGGFIDTGGDDTYMTSGPAFCGSAWDQSISLFYDHLGDDSYSSKGFSLAASAHNSIASFWDISGNDEFSSPSTAGCVSSNQYHGGYSLSYFFSSNATIASRINSKKQEFVLSSPPMTQDFWNASNPDKISLSLFTPLLKHNNSICR